MNCERFQSIASDLARNDIIEATERTNAMAHLDECEQCEELWIKQGELSDRLRMVVKGMNSLQAPDHLEAKLRQAFRERTAVASHLPPASQYGRYWLSAAAAALLVFLGLIGWRAYVVSGPRQPLQTSSKDRGAVPSELSNVGDARQKLSDSELVAPKLPKRRRPGQRHQVASAKRPPAVPAGNPAVNNATREEVATDFVALGYGSAMDLQDGGQLVRVELPRSALARFGLPMNMDRADERVKADVLVGADGLAKAIRFVK